MAKSVAITGGNRGIGRALTDGFLAAGYKVAVGARQRLDLDSLGADVTFVEMDVRNQADHVRLVEAAQALGDFNWFETSIE